MLASDSDLPRSFKEAKSAAAALVGAVNLARHQDPNATAEDIASMLEISRTIMHETRGTKRLLPHNGTAKERIALFTKAIEKVQSRTDGGKPLDPEAVVSECARACGNRREIFGAIRKAVKRSGHE